MVGLVGFVVCSKIRRREKEEQEYNFDRSNKKAPVTNNLWERTFVWLRYFDFSPFHFHPSQQPYININININVYTQAHTYMQCILAIFFHFLHLINYTVHSISAGHNVIAVFLQLFHMLFADCESEMLLLCYCLCYVFLSFLGAIN